jgi:hypothetical protein
MGFSMGQLVLKMSAWQLSAHRRNAVFASQAGVISEGGTTDQHGNRSSEPDAEGGTTDQHVNRSSEPVSDSEGNHDDNAQLASSISSTPPLALTDTSSVDDSSFNDRIPNPETPTSPLESMQPLSDAAFGTVHKQDSEVETARLLLDSQFLKNESATSSELLTLWPENPEMLTASHSREIHDTAAFLAGAAIFEDAFDLFHLEYRCWQVQTSIITTDEAICRIATAAINCARTCRSSLQQGIAQQLLGRVLETLMERGLGYSTDSALLHLHLSVILKSSQKQRSRDHEDAAIRTLADLKETSFAVIATDIQDRESIFMATAFKQISVNGVLIDSWYTTLPHPRKNIEQKVRHSDHLSRCEDLVERVRTLLLQCRYFISTNHFILDKAVGPLSQTVDFQVSAAWLFYCYCASELSPIDSPILLEQQIFQSMSCRHEGRQFWFDTIPALSIITETFLSLKTKWRYSGPRFSSLCIGAIEAILDTTAKYEDISKAYVSRLGHLLEGPYGITVTPATSSVLVKPLLKQYITGTVLAAHQPGFVTKFTMLSQTISKVYQSQQPLATKSSRTSIAGSVQSSINTVRSSMSFDTKLMLGLKFRLRGRHSQLSIRSKDTRSSKAASTHSYEEDSFENVTGMPGMHPPVSSFEHRDTIIVEPIDEEDTDIDMQDAP